MRILYTILFSVFTLCHHTDQEYSCVDKKYSRLSKISIKDELLTYINERGLVQEYKIIDNSQINLMAIKKASDENDPILNYIFIIKDNTLVFNSIFRSVKSSYNEIYANEFILKCVGITNKNLLRVY